MHESKIQQNSIFSKLYLSIYLSRIGAALLLVTVHESKILQNSIFPKLIQTVAEILRENIINNENENKINKKI